MSEDEKEGKGNDSGRRKDESFKLWSGLPRSRDPEGGEDRSRV